MENSNKLHNVKNSLNFEQKHEILISMSNFKNSISLAKYFSHFTGNAACQRKSTLFKAKLVNENPWN